MGKAMHAEPLQIDHVTGTSIRAHNQELCERTLILLALLVTVSASVASADTCSYTYNCGSSAACAQLMGGYSRTLTESAPDMNFDKCESIRKSVIPGGSTPCTCTSGNTTGATEGPKVAVGHNLQQNMVSLGANMMVSNIKNPVMGQFMSGFTNSFLQTVFDNQAEAQRQRAIMEQQLAEQRRQREEQRRIAEQQRIDAMFARLNNELKLEGVPFGLTLKPMNSNAGLQLKTMNSSGPDDLTLKLGQADSAPTSYGLKGLPGMYVGGPAGPNSAQNPSANPNLASGPGTGTTGPGIPGLPGIYLDQVQPEQAAQVAQAATHLTGPDQALAEDAALQAAEKNPALVGPSDDPKVQTYQQTAEQYDQAATATKNAEEQWNESLSRADADKSVIDMARTKLDTENATPAQQQAFNQMLQAAKTDEDAADTARRIFDGANANLTITRANAANALASLAPPSGASTTISNLKSSATVDLSHAKSTAPTSLKLGMQNGVPISDGPAHIASAAPKLAPVQELGACLSTASGHPLTALPTTEQLRTQLVQAQDAIRRMVEDRETEEDIREMADEQVKDAVHDAKKQAFDLTVDFLMHKAQAGVRSGVWESGHDVEQLETLAANEADAAKRVALQTQLQQAKIRNENLKAAAALLEKSKQRLEGRARIRDFGEWTDKPEELATAKGYAEGVKQLVQAALAENKVKAALGYTPYVNDIVKWGGSLIDTSYDLLEEYFSSKELDQYNNDSTQYLKGLESLNQRVKVSVAQLNCYKKDPSAPPAQVTSIQR